MYRFLIAGLMGLVLTNPFSLFAEEKAKKSALIIVDMQKCFVHSKDGKTNATHSLPVTGGRSLVEGINEFQKKFDLVVATKDWHTVGHISFASSHKGKKPFDNLKLDYSGYSKVIEGYKFPGVVVEEPGKSHSSGDVAQDNEKVITQTLWPDHCIQGTEGADYVDGLSTSNIAKVIYKGNKKNVDSYSGFFDNFRDSQTELHNYLQTQGVTDIYVVGLAADFCVKFTSIDGAFLKYNTHFVYDLTRAVFNSKDAIYDNYDVLESKGVNLVDSKKVESQKTAPKKD